MLETMHLMTIPNPVTLLEMITTWLLKEQLHPSSKVLPTSSSSSCVYMHHHHLCSGALPSTFFDPSAPSMRKVDEGKRKFIMSFIVATNTIASRPPECRPERRTLVPKDCWSIDGWKLRK